MEPYITLRFSFPFGSPLSGIIYKHGASGLACPEPLKDQQMEPPDNPLVAQCSNGVILGGSILLDPLGGLGRFKRQDAHSTSTSVGPCRAARFLKSDKVAFTI